MTVNAQDSAGRSAFLALDFVRYIIDNFSSDPAVAERAASVLAAARAARLPVIHVVPDQMQDQIHPLMAPAAGERVLRKTSMSAFATTSLDQLLREAGISHLVIAGVATSGTVLSTNRWAVDTGYRVTVCEEACADMDPEVHAALTDESVFPKSWLGLWRIARVLPAARIGELGS